MVHQMKICKPTRNHRSNLSTFEWDQCNKNCISLIRSLAVMEAINNLAHLHTTTLHIVILFLAPIQPLLFSNASTTWRNPILYRFLCQYFSSDLMIYYTPNNER